MTGDPFFEREWAAHQALAEATRTRLAAPFAAMRALWLKTVRDGGKILFFGNGGSAADAQHLAAELSVRFRTSRRALAGLALTTDSSVLTAAANDFGFETVFARQIEALARPGDLALGISTSGRSPNVLKALAIARELKIATAGFSGERPNDMVGLCDCLLAVPSTETARIQEIHIVLGQMLCAALEIDLGLG